MSDQDFTGDVFANVWESLVKLLNIIKKGEINGKKHSKKANRISSVY